MNAQYQHGKNDFQKTLVNNTFLFAVEVWKLIIFMLVYEGNDNNVKNRTVDRQGKWLNLGQGQNSDNQLSTAISAPALLKEPHNCA